MLVGVNKYGDSFFAVGEIILENTHYQLVLFGAPRHHIIIESKIVHQKTPPKIAFGNKTKNTAAIFFIVEILETEIAFDI